MRAEPLVDRHHQSKRLDHLSLPELLLHQGSMTGPYRRLRPATLGWWQRVARAIRAWRIEAMAPKGTQR